MSAQLQLRNLGDSLAASKHRDIVALSEWTKSEETYTLSKRDRQLLKMEVNDGATRIEIEYDEHGDARFRARQFVGVVSLPDGPVIHIAPKAAGKNLLYLLRYSQSISSTTVNERVGLQTGDSFIDALAALFTTELEEVLRRGLHKEYQSTQETKSHVRGRIDLQRQLQRQGTTPTAFECRYSTQTKEIIANETILYAGSLLRQLVADEELRQKLEWQTTQLRKVIELRQVHPRELAEVEVTRLNGYYADILRLAEPVIRNMHVENFEAGLRDSFSLLVNMNTVFERVVERALGEVVSDISSLSVTPQKRTTNLIQGTKDVRMYPDFVVENTETEKAVLVGDTKWKTGSVDHDDLYQITAYILAQNAPGVLIHPAQEQSLATDFTVDDEWPLTVIGLPTNTEVSKYNDFVKELEGSIKSVLDRRDTSTHFQEKDLVQ